jgi:hypothetical protein
MAAPHAAMCGTPCRSIRHSRATRILAELVMQASFKTACHSRRFDRIGTYPPPGGPIRRGDTGHEHDDEQIASLGRLGLAI